MSIILLLFILFLIAAVVLSFFGPLVRYMALCLVCAMVCLSILTGVLHL